MSSDGSADRIHEESDPVRVEVETALRRRVPLIPVLIGSTKMPSSDLLPPSLKDFAFRNAVKVDTGQDFDYHMDRLIRSMDAILEQAPKSPPSRETKAADTAAETEHAPSVSAARRRRSATQEGYRQPPRRRRPRRRQGSSVAMPVSFMSTHGGDRRLARDGYGRQTSRDGCCGSASPARSRCWRWSLLVFGLSGGSGNFGQRLLTLSGHAGA